MNEMEKYDISPVLETNMPGWHTHPSLGMVHNHRNFEQSGYYAQTLVMSEHTGAHVDAPIHIHGKLASIDEIPIDAMIGPYKKYDITSYKPKAGEPVTLEILKEIEERDNFRLEKGDIVLLDFGWDQYFKPDSKDPHEREWWGKNEPGLTEEACKYFYEAGIKAVGSDTPAADICIVNGNIISAFGHAQYFLPNNILILEGLQNLNKIPIEGVFMATPLKIKGGSGSPIRPIVFG